VAFVPGDIRGFDVIHVSNFREGLSGKALGLGYSTTLNRAPRARNRKRTTCDIGDTLMRRFVWTAIFLLLGCSQARADKLVRIAGGGTEIDNVPAVNAKLSQPFGIDFDKAGSYYLVELTGQRILKVDTKGTLTILGGTGKKGNSGDAGPATKATFNGMHSLAVTPAGILYAADTWNNRVRKLDTKSGIIQAFAGTSKKASKSDGSPALQADLGGIYCVAFNFDQSKLYLTDLDLRKIYYVDMKTGMLHHVAGNGLKGVPKDGSDAKAAPLVDPRAACVDRQGNVYILERGGHAMRVVNPAGKIRTVVGTGMPGNSGDGGDALMATLKGPKHLCVDLDDNVIIADTANHVIRKYTPKDGKIIRLAGTGKKGESNDGGAPLTVSFNEPHGVLVHRTTGVLYIVDSMNHRVFRWEK
jgi:DNA-binding beta-propeller fold protein YncE